MRRHSSARSPSPRPEWTSATRASRSARSRSTSGRARAISGTRTRAGRPASSEVGDRLHVDRGLAAAGHAVEQERTRIPGPDRGDDLPDGLRLGGQEIARRRTATAQPDGSGGQRPSRPLADIGVGEPSTDEPRDRRVAVPAGEVRRRQLPGGRDGELPERCDLARSETAAPWWSRRSPATSRRRDPRPRGRSSARSAGPSRRRSASTRG